MKAIKKILAGLGLSLLIGISGLVTLILQPQIVFAHKVDYKNFRIYSNQILGEEIKGYLDQAQVLVNQSELKDAAYTYDIFLANGSFYNSIDDMFLGSWSAARAVDNNVIIKVPVDLKEGLCLAGNSTMDIVYVLAHEMIHCLQENRYGKARFNPFRHPPMWKLEGLPEYIGRDRFSNTDPEEVRKIIGQYVEGSSKAEEGYIQLKEDLYVPEIYFKGMVMTEYLLEIKGISYDELLDEKYEESAVWEEMMRWMGQ